VRQKKFHKLRGLAIMDIEQLKKKDGQKWSEFIETHQNSSIYHTLEWKKVLEDTYGYKPHYLLAKNDTDEITGILPLFEVKSFIFGNRLVSLPFSYCAGALYTDMDSAAKLLDYAIDLTIEQDFDYLELKQGLSDLDESKLVKTEEYVTSILKLSKNSDDIWKNVKRDKKRGIKKAQKEGVVVREIRNKEELKEFYTMVLETRKGQGVPPYPFSFFENMYKYMKDSLKIFFSYYKDNPVAGGIFQLHKNKVLYGYGMTRKEEALLKLYPMNLLIWKAIEWACKNNYTMFDFGATPIKQESLLYFKSSWGAETQKVPYYYFLNRIKEPLVFNPISSRFKLMTTIWKKIPIPIAKRIGPYIIRHVG